MKKFEYKIFNMSECSERLIEDKKTERRNIVQVLNQHGENGWQVIQKIKDTSFLMMREIDLTKTPDKINPAFLP